MAQLSINLAAIFVSGTTVLTIQRLLYHRRKQRHQREELPDRALAGAER